MAQNAYRTEFCLENYNCVGFDLDHTICLYKLDPLFHLIYKKLSTFLVLKYDYPKDLLSVSASEMSLAQKGIIMDKRRGNFLKLNYQYKIVKASHGTNLLSSTEIEQIYGKNLTWDECKGIPQKIMTNSGLEDSFYIFKDYFVTPGAVVCAKMVDIIDKQNGKPSYIYSVWDHYLEGLLHIYEQKNYNIFLDLEKNPDKYLKPCSKKLKQWLEVIGKEKVTFLLTSSDRASFLAEYSLGKDWKKYFDIIVTSAHKPQFFSKNEPLCTVSQDNELGDGNPCNKKPKVIYSQGSWKHFKEACALLSETKDPKILYFGDSIIDDVCAASAVTGCDTVAIVEELLAEGMENAHLEQETSGTLVSEYWGSFFGNKIGNNENEPSLWTYLLSRYSKLAIPGINAIADLSLNGKILCFSSKSTLSGFYPHLPKIFSSS